jgi:N utilization substance protein B
VTEPREQAVQALYEADRRRTPEPDLSGLGAKARRLVEGVLSHLPELDVSIEAASEHWTIDRMPVVDRAVLRLGLYELRHERDTPTAVVLSEAVRVAKEYSTAQSGRFVNGVLAALAAIERPDDGG